jgi:hypothetical protein
VSSQRHRLARSLLGAAMLVVAAPPLGGQPGTTAPTAAAHILLDKAVHAGDLVLFPDLADDKSWYYVSDQPHLALDDGGRPQFSFLRWVSNVRSGAKEAEAREGEGGGIVHALVELAVSKQQIQEAQRELQRTHPGAKIVGLVPWSSGTFGIVSSFKDPKGNLSTQVLGLGKAPLLDGEKAAISIQLTKLGAKVLWESFSTPTPDISFTFEMELQGYHSPLSAKVEANWDQVYRHEAFGAGFASTYIAADINAAFDDLRRNGAIKVTQVGNDSAMDGIVRAAYDKLTEMMFSKVESLDPANLSKGPTAAAQGQSLLDRAGSKLKDERAAAETRNTGIRTRNEAIRKRNAERDKARLEQSSAGDSAAQAQAKADRLKQEAAAARAESDRLKAEWEAKKGGAVTRPIAPSPTPDAKDPFSTPGRAAAAPLEWLPMDARKKVPTGVHGPSDPSPAPPGPSAPSPSTPTNTPVQPAAGASGSSGCAKGDAACEGAFSAYNTAKGKADEADQKAKQAQDDADKLKSGSGSDAERKRLAAEPNEQEIPEESAPGFALLATYELREVHQSGTFVLDMNKYLTGSLVTRFDENVGDLRRLIKEAEHFRQVNLDDPLYQQREIVAMVDGYDAKGFGEWINFVTVQLRKKHAGGAETTDEVRIDRQNFNQAGNAFKLLYGWNGDGDRRQWLDYEYRVVWSFFGGKQIEQPWRKASAGAIDLAPPFARRRVALEADPAEIGAAGVRLITTRIYYTAGGSEQVKQVTLEPAKQQLSSAVEILLPANEFDYGYEVLWRLAGNKTVSSGRQTSSEGVLFVDEIPLH